MKSGLQLKIITDNNVRLTDIVIKKKEAAGRAGSARQRGPNGSQCQASHAAVLIARSRARAFSSLSAPSVTVPIT